MSSRSVQVAFVSGLLLSLAIQAGASIIVAAKDSPGQQRADFVCDGVNDQVEIQKAIDALPPSGGVVELLEGTFHFGNDVEITKHNVTIRGAGKSTILKDNPTYWVKLTKDAAKGDRDVTVKDASQFHVGQLIGITNEDINPTEEHSPEKFKKIKETNSFYYYTVYLIRGDLYLVESIKGNVITLDRGLENPMLTSTFPRTAPAWVMIRAYAKENLELRDFSIDCNWNNVAKIYGGGEYSHHPGPEPARADDYVCPFPQMIEKLHHGEEGLCAIYMDSAHNSTFKNLNIYDIASTAILLIESNYVLAQGNTIRHFGLKGYVNPFGDYTRIIGNVVEHSLYEDGINVYAHAANFSVVSNNIVRHCPRVCISLNQSRRGVVSGNNVEGGGVGIAIVSKDAAVTGNYIESSGVGMLVQGIPSGWGDDAADYPVTITGNTLRSCTMGVLINNSNHLNLVGNSFAGTGRPITGSGDRFIISSNQFINGASDGNPAIGLSGDNHFIFGNKIRGFAKGIKLESTAEGNRVERNAFVDVPETIVDEGTNNVVEGNL